MVETINVGCMDWKPKRAWLLLFPMALCAFPLSAADAVEPSVVCIDPGHPSEVGWGTRGRHSTEAQVAWDVAIGLRSVLEGQGIRVVLTKSAEKEFVRNRRRAEIANTAGAALMIRLHCDALSGSGFAVYYPDRQGIAEGRRGPDPRVIRSSAAAARAIHRSLVDGWQGLLKDRGLHGDVETRVGRAQGALTGSVFSHVPVVLVEMCVLTNPRDESVLTSGAGRQRMAQALAAGIDAALGR